MDLDTKQRIPPQREKILELLRNAGKNGVTNRDLVRIALNYKARLQELYERGYVIEVIKLNQGLFRYVLVEEPEVEKTKPIRAIDLLKETIEVKYGGEVTSKQLEVILSRMNLQVVRRSGSHKQVVEKQIELF